MANWVGRYIHGLKVSFRPNGNGSKIFDRDENGTYSIDYPVEVLSCNFISHENDYNVTQDHNYPKDFNVDMSYRVSNMGRLYRNYIQVGGFTERPFLTIRICDDDFLFWNEINADVLTDISMEISVEQKKVESQKQLPVLGYRSSFVKHLVQPADQARKQPSRQQAFISKFFRV